MLAIPAFQARTQTALFRGRVSWQRRYQCGHADNCDAHCGQQAVQEQDRSVFGIEGCVSMIEEACKCVVWA